MVALQKDYSTGTQKSQERPRPKVSLEVIDMWDVMHTEYPPLQWIVPDYLPEGLTMLFADPKAGKSMTMLALMLRMARRTSGGMDGEVLYLSLDDTNPRRLQSRARSLLMGEEFEKNRMFVSWTSETMDDGFLDQLEEWMYFHSETKLICVDIYARIKPSSGDEVYKRDYLAAVRLQEFATKHHIALVVIHHTNKRRNESGAHWMNRISGSNGLAGAVDTMWFIERKENTNNLRLNILGRDTMGELHVRFTLDDINAPWELEEPETDGETIETRKQAADIILAAMQNNKEAMKPHDITAATGLKHATVLGTLRRMLTKNYISQTTYGAYKPVILVFRKENEADTGITAHDDIQELQNYKHEHSDESCNSVILVSQDSPESEADAGVAGEHYRITNEIATEWIPCISLSCNSWVPNTAWKDETVNRGKSSFVLHMATCPKCKKTFNRDAQRIGEEVTP